MTASIDRRAFLSALPALMAAPALAAQRGPAPIRIHGFNHVTLTVSDLKRSVAFYQDLFGMPVQSRQGSTTVSLQVGAGPQSLGLSSVSANAAPAIDHMCVGVEDFSVDRLLKVLAQHGVARSDTREPNTVRVRMRGPESGGAKEGTPELYVADPDGIVLQLQDPRYCGGGGVLGNQCTPEPTPKSRLLAAKGYSHCTVFSSDAARANAFHQKLFGLGIRSYQGPTAPTLAVGSGVEFLMFTGGGAGRGGAAAAPPRPASINHFCLTVDDFNPDRLIKTLESLGIKPRDSQTGPVGPLRHYISMRMENRGGAKEGTPELYFTDPDGLLVQLQDVSYCGGSGVLGNACPPL